METYMAGLFTLALPLIKTYAVNAPSTTNIFIIIPAIILRTKTLGFLCCSALRCKSSKIKLVKKSKVLAIIKTFLSMPYFSKKEVAVKKKVLRPRKMIISGRICLLFCITVVVVLFATKVIPKPVLQNIR